MTGLPPEPQWRTDEAIQCLECGEWKRALGNHLRLTHGLSAADYRSRWGMRQRQPLTCGEVSAERRRIAIDTGGAERIRTFADATLPAAQAAAQRREHRPQERDTTRQLGLARGRAMKDAAAERIARADVQIAGAGFDSRHAWLTAHYLDAQWTLADCAAHLDLTVGMIQKWMRANGIQARPPGPRTPSPKIDPTK